MNRELLGKGREKIIEVFYKNRNREVYFRELMRQSGLTQSSTLKHLRFLEQIDLVTSKKKMSNTFYKLNKDNELIYAVLSYFDNKFFNLLPSLKKRAISYFLEKIETKPLIALIFGSTAKGTSNKESDIDLLLIFNKEELQDDKIKKDIKSLTSIAIHPFVISLEYFKEQLLKGEDSTILDAINTGFVIIGHYYLYKEVLKKT